MTEIEEAIGKVEGLYRAVTGRDAPELTNAYAPIPAERDPVHHVEEQMARLMTLVGGERDARAQPAPPLAWMPAISVWATNEETQICVDIPGVTRQEVDVSVHGRAIVVTGRRSPQPGHERPRFAEQPSGAFRRIIPVPLGARVEQMNASLRDGVLVLRMPNEPAEASQARSISVS